MFFNLNQSLKNDEREIINRFYPTPYFFSARVFQEMELVSIELTKVYRQSDKIFVNVLDHIRTNTAGAADLQLLNTRYNTHIEENESDMYITLATRRDTVDFINEKKLSELPGESTILTGRDTRRISRKQPPHPNGTGSKTRSTNYFYKKTITTTVG